MSTKIDLKQVKAVAKLSRLEITEGQAEEMSEKLSAILGHIEKLDELDTENVEPLAHCLPIHNPRSLTMLRGHKTNFQLNENSNGCSKLYL